MPDTVEFDLIEISITLEIILNVGLMMGLNSVISVDCLGYVEGNIG